MDDVQVINQSNLKRDILDLSKLIEINFQEGIIQYTSLLN